MQEAPRLGPYQLTRLIGQGSFGAVYQAVHTETQALVAVKVLLDPAQVEEEGFKRFWLEGQVGLRLRDPAIVPVLEVGRGAKGQPYLAMEYVEGPTLATHLRDRRLDVEEATRLVLTLARAVARIHAAGVLHRDLKPANVILDARTQTPRITDFGLARDPTLIRSLTQTGERLGTPAYMAPEQVQARKGLNARVDVYALGVIYFECLTGSRPHQAGTVLQLFDQIVRVASPPPSTRRPDLPAQVDKICARALALDPNDRYLDCAALADDLEALLQHGSEPPRTTRHTVLATGTLALVLGGVVAAGLVSLFLSKPSPDLADGSPQSTPGGVATDATPRSLVEAVAEVERLRGASPGQASELARAWAQRAGQRLESGEALKARELAQHVSLLQVAGVDPAEPSAAAVRRWCLTHEGAVSQEDRQVLHELCETHLEPADVSALDVWFGESLLGRGRFAEVDLSFRNHQQHLRGEDRFRARLAVAQAASGKRTGWNVTPGLLSELAQIAPSSSVAGLTAKSLLMTRQARWRRGDRSQEREVLQRALTFARDAVARDPGYLPAQIALARVLTRQKSPEAKEAWTRALSLGPENVLIPMAHERAFRRDKGVRRAAQDRFLSLTVGTKSYPRAKNLLARGWERVREREPGAKSDLEECLELRPFELRVHFGLGLLALRAGDSSEAKERLSLALAMPAEHRGRREGWEPPTAILSQLDPAEREQIQRLSVLPDPAPFLAEVDPSQRRSLLEAAALSMKAGQADEVRALLTENLAAVKSDPARALVLARLCVGRDFVDLALEALEFCPPNRTSELIRADVVRRRGYLSQALGAYKRLGEGTDAVAAIARAEGHLLTENWKGADEAACELLAKHRGSPLVYRAELIRGAAILRERPGQAMLLLARARRIVGDMDVRATLLQLQAFVGLIGKGRRAWLPSDLMRAVLFLAPGGNAVLQVVLPLLDFLQGQPDPDLIRHVEGMLETVGQCDNPRVHVALGSLRLLQKTPPGRVFEHWQRALELDSEVRFQARDLEALSKRSPDLAARLEGLRRK